MRRWFLFFISVLAAVSLTSAQGSLTPDLVSKISSSPPDEFVPITLILSPQADLTDLTSRVGSLPKAARRQQVIAELKSIAQLSQIGLLADLKALAAAGQARRLRPLWIVNAITAHIQAAEISGLLQRHPEVARAVWDPPRLGAESPPDIVDVADETGWGLLDIHADSVWNLGYRGQGVVVGLLDSGMDYNHPDLRDRVWVNPGEDLNGNGLVDSSDWNGVDDDGNTYVDDLRGWDFYFDSSEVSDAVYSGTQAAGIILGDGSGANVTGVAPQAKAMILKCFSGATGDFIEAEQYAILMNADLINSSLVFKWNWLPPPDYAVFRQAEAALLAAGLVHSSAIGFDGLNQTYNPLPFNIPAPANCPAPWLHPSQTLQGGLAAVLASGAYNAAHQLRDSSSLGPSAWNLPDILSLNPHYPWTTTWPDSFNDYPWRQGQYQGLIKPDLGAPTGVISDHPGGLYSIAGGTLAASAHTAGTLALLLSAYPQADPAMLARIIMSTAVDSGAPGKDNRWGAGRLDAYAAMTQLLSELGVVPPENGSSSPAEWKLYPAHPNPFNATTVISYQLRAASYVSLRVYDLSGSVVKMLVNGWKMAGKHEVTFDGSELSSGIYFVKMQATEGGLRPGEYTQSRKLVLLK